MQMTEKEIVRNYIGAKNKSTQVEILADLNLLPKDEIIRILKDNGISFPPKRGAKNKKEQEAYKKVMGEDKQKPVIKKTIKSPGDDPKAAVGKVPDIVLQMVNEKIGEMQEKLDAIIAHEKQVTKQMNELKEFVKNNE